MGVAHTHYGLVDVESLLLQSAKLKPVHHIIICLLGIEVLCTRLVGCERSDAVSQTFLHEVVAKVHVVVTTYSCCNIQRTCPVALCEHLKHHKVVLVQSALACERDNHTVRYGVACHHHSALLHSLFIDGQIESVGRDDVHIAVLGAHPVLHDVLHLKRLVAKLSASLSWMFLVEIHYLLLERRVYLNIVVGA